MKIMQEKVSYVRKQVALAYVLKTSFSNFCCLLNQNYNFKNMTTEKLQLNPKNEYLYICLDASDGEIEKEILEENEFCKVKMLGAKSCKELSEKDLKEADVVAVWHTINLDHSLLSKLSKPPKVILNSEKL